MRAEEEWRRVCLWAGEELAKDLAEYRPFILVAWFTLSLLQLYLCSYNNQYEYLHNF